MDTVHVSIESSIEIEQRRQLVANWIQDSLAPVGRLLNHDASVESESPHFEVREYQLDAWAALWEARQAGETHGLIHLATGLGKTSVGVFDAMKFREEFRAEHGRNPKIMFAVHQTDILDQAAERFGAFIPDAKTSFYTGREKNTRGDIVFATYQSLHANLKTLDPKTFDYIIDDEVHHARADTYEKVVKHFKPDFRLGLTATPNRADDKDIREIYGQELYSKGLAEALSEDWLATPDYHIVFDDAVKEAMQSSFQANSLKALKELFDVRPRNDTIADNIREEIKKIGLEIGSVKTIVFCQDIEHANEMAELLNGKAYHSGTEDKDRKKIFDEFKHGNLQVITTRDMFNEGVDVPDARLLVFLRSTSSQTIFEQQLGRGLRKVEGKDRVSVLDFVANVERIAMVKELADQVKKPRNTGDTNEGDAPEGGNIIDKDTLVPTENGFAIHTNHGDFDFDRQVVDLLKSYQELSVRVRSRLDDYGNGVLINQLQQLSEQLGRVPTSTDVARASKTGVIASINTFQKTFGSWNEALVQSGFTPNVRQGLSEEQLLQELKDFATEIGRIPSIKDIDDAKKARRMQSSQHYRKVFGTWRDVLVAADLETKRTEISEEQLIDGLRGLADTLGRSPTSSELRAAAKDGLLEPLHIYTQRFGSFRNAQEAAGLKTHKIGTLTDEELLEKLKNYTDSLDHLPGQEEWHKAAKDKLLPYPEVYRKRFGTMNNAFTLIGLRPTRATKGVTIEQVEEQLKALAEELGHPPTVAELKAASKLGKVVSPSTIHNLGGRKLLYERIGFGDAIPKKMNNVTNEEIITQLQSLAEELGKRPTKSDITAASKVGKIVSYTLIAKRFGAYSTAIDEAMHN